MKQHVKRIAQRIAFLRRQPQERYFHFEVRHESPFKRPPLHQTMMLDDLKIMYLPIAKNACSSMKRLVAELGGVRLEPKEDIHRKLDNDKTGLLFVNRSDDDIKKALSESDWMRFVVFRNPIDRLISAYIEKFVINRESPGVFITCDPVLMRTMKLGWLRKRDYRRGITFRAFVEDVLSQPPNMLDPHWRPQSEYLKLFPFTHIYDLKTLEGLSHDLEEHIGRTVEMPRLNAFRQSDTDKVYVKGAFDLLPKDLPRPECISEESFLDEDLKNRIAHYFSEDISIYNRIQR